MRERETKRILHEEELRRLEADGTPEDSTSARASERNRNLQLEKTQRALEELQDDIDEWYFDCSVCGRHGKNLVSISITRCKCLKKLTLLQDDGTHSMACESCSVWQHSACHGISEAEADSDEFHFLCASCKNPKVTSLKLRMGPATSSLVENHVSAQDIAAKPTPFIQVPPLQQHMSGVKSELNGDAHDFARHAGVPVFPPSQQTPRNQIQSILSSTKHHAMSASNPVIPSNGPLSLPLPLPQPHAQKMRPAREYGPQQGPISPQDEAFMSNANRSHPAPSSVDGLPRLHANILAQPKLSHDNIPTPTNARFPADLAASPTPSLRATEGNTSVLFSASPKPSGSPRSNSYNAILATNGLNNPITYAGSSSPQPASPNLRNLSPTKSSPPPQQSHPSSRKPQHFESPYTNQNGTSHTALQQPSTISTTPTAISPFLSPFTTAAPPLSHSSNGASPIKHNMQLSPTPATLGLDGAVDLQHSFASSPAPVLSPSINVGAPPQHPPVKKAVSMNEEGMATVEEEIREQFQSS